MFGFIVNIVCLKIFNIRIMYVMLKKFYFCFRKIQVLVKFVWIVEYQIKIIILIFFLISQYVKDGVNYLLNFMEIKLFFEVFFFKNRFWNLVYVVYFVLYFVKIQYCLCSIIIYYK